MSMGLVGLQYGTTGTVNPDLSVHRNTPVGQRTQRSARQQQQHCELCRRKHTKHHHQKQQLANTASLAHLRTWDGLRALIRVASGVNTAARLQPGHRILRGHP